VKPLVAIIVFCAVLPAQTDTRPLKKRAADLVNAELPAEALKILVRAQEQTPRDPEVRVYAGEAHFQLEEYEKAVAAFREAIAIDPGIAPFLPNLGHALLKLQKTAEARAQFQLIVEKAKQPAAKARALAGVGVALAEEGDEKGARSSFEKALEIDPELDRARYRLALIQLKAGEAEAAATHLLAIVKEHPLYEGAAYNLGLAYRALGNDAAAKEWEEKFKQVRKAKKELEDLKLAWKQTGRIELMAGIARVYARSGEAADAVSWFSRYLAAKPDDAAAKAELDAIRAKLARK
jgi:tetratricopeptide (TPR) repeat protein